MHINMSARIVLAILAGTAAALWALGIFVRLSPGADRADMAGAISATNVAAVLGVGWAQRDRDKDALVRAMADFTLRRSQAVTLPLRRVV